MASCRGSHHDWYAFRHALIRDVAYEKFIGTRVRPIHRLIARALERGSTSEDVPPDDLAYHSWAVGDAVRCIWYNELAGDEAVAGFANHDAHVYYARARSFASPGSEQHRRLTVKLEALEWDASQPPGAETGERQSPSQRDHSTRPLPPVRWTPR